MEDSINERRSAMLMKIKNSISKVDNHTTRLKRSNSRLIFISLLTSSIATLLAGFTAALGPLAGEGPPAWKLTCGVIAVFTFIAGLSTGLHQRFSISDRLAKSYACIGRLSALEIALTVTGRDPLVVAKEFEEVTAAYPDFILL